MHALEKLLICVCGMSLASHAAPAAASETKQPVRRTLEAAPLGRDMIHLDGRLDEPAWSRAPVGSDFVQREPRDGDPPTYRTEVRVLQDETALWVGVRAFDPEPQKIVGHLTRRDVDSDSDWIVVLVDSYSDRRTSFDFRINPAGVKRDLLESDDGTTEDSSWDAVWEAEAHVDSAGWAAEFHIPVNQLRFKPGASCRFGFQVGRAIERNSESSYWNPWPREAPGMASSFGDLVALALPGAPRRMQVLPYMRLSGLSQPVTSGDPFRERSAFDGDGGVDAKVGFGGNLTLDATVNPDFGQVEADPSVVNLTAFETFFPEKRPFFIEGSNILRFGLGVGDGDGANESLFYSRRIGRAPHGDPEGEFVDSPAATSIAAAGKLTGKTPSGWSIGVLDAVTPREMASVAIDTSSTGASPLLRHREIVEPQTNYFVGRVQRDLRQGRTALGAILTSVHRNLNGAAIDGLRDRAFTGGVDFKHRFAADNYSLDGYFVGSEIHGSRAAIVEAQLSPQRYYQRPDADYVRVDSTRTSLRGTAGSLTLGKVGGGHWRGMYTSQFRSPGFESNDLGYLRTADDVAEMFWAGYREWKPGKVLRSYNINYNLWRNWTWGGDPTNTGTNVNANWGYNNLWFQWCGIAYNTAGFNTRALRGGPSVRIPANLNGWIGLESDSRKPLAGEIEYWFWKDFDKSRSYGVTTQMTIRPAPRWSLELSPRYEHNMDDWAWVGAEEVGSATDYVMAHMVQETAAMTVRFNYAFTPDLSLEFYAQPYLSAGKYTGFKRVTDPRASRYDDLMTPYERTAYDAESNTYTLSSADGDLTVDNPDFNFGELRSNLILRWEFRPGSTLFVVWSQGRTDDPLKGGRIALSRDTGDLLGVDSENVLLAKVTYWLPI